MSRVSNPLDASLNKLYLDSVGANLKKHGMTQASDDGKQWGSEYGMIEIDHEHLLYGLMLRGIISNEVGVGHGSWLLKLLCSSLDEAFAPCYLFAHCFDLDEDGGTMEGELRAGGLNNTQLRAWYKRYGFDDSANVSVCRERGAMFRPVPQGDFLDEEGLVLPCETSN